MKIDRDSIRKICIKFFEGCSSEEKNKLAELFYKRTDRRIEVQDLINGFKQFEINLTKKIQNRNVFDLPERLRILIEKYYSQNN